jgi:hypothetical protein
MQYYWIQGRRNRRASSGLMQRHRWMTYGSGKIIPDTHVVGECVYPCMLLTPFPKQSGRDDTT